MTYIVYKLIIRVFSINCFHHKKYDFFKHIYIQSRDKITTVFCQMIDFFFKKKNFILSINRLITTYFYSNKK